MIALFNELFYRPLFNGLILLYENATFGDLGIAIVLLTVIVRTLLYPLFHKSARNQRIMQMIQPQIKKIQVQHKDDREKQAAALLEVYKTHRVNPFSGFLLLLVQIPVLFALYQVFFKGLAAGSFDALYSFVARPAELNFNFLGLINLHEASMLMVAFAAIAQYVQGWLALPPQKKGEELGAQEKIAKQMVFLAPAITLVILFKLPSAIALYWLTSSLFSIAQQLVVNKSLENFGAQNGQANTI